MASSLIDVCRFNPTAGGTTDWTYSSAVQGYQGLSAAGAVNGATYSYRAESADLTQWEVGTGVYNSGTGVLSRAAVLFNSSGTTSKINFSSAPQVAVVALAEDLLTANITKVIQQAGTDTGKGVTPATQQHHDSAAKAWVEFTGSTGAILASYNVTSVTRTGAGLYTVNFTTSFASANYAYSFTSNGAGFATFGNGNQLAGSVDIRSQVSGVNTDITQGMLIAFGRQ